jgi:hypothetical protein
MDEMVQEFQEQTKIENVMAAMTAYHEAGHAVLAAVDGFIPREATMVGLGKGRDLGSVWTAAEYENALEAVISGVTRTMAGMVAERLYAEHEGLFKEFVGVEDQITGGAASDRKDARRIMKVHFGTISRSDEKKWMAVFEKRAVMALTKHWEAVEAVAKALLKEYRLDQARLAELLGDIANERKVA